MNENDILAGVRADVPPISPAARQRGLALLTRDMDDAPAPAPARRQPRRPGWRIAVPSAAVAVLAAVAAVVAVVVPADPSATESEAAEVLLLAAGSLEQHTVEPRPDQFRYREIVEYPSYGVVPDYRLDFQFWESVDGSRPGEAREITQPCGRPDEPGQRCTVASDLVTNEDASLPQRAPYTVLSTLPTDPGQMLDTLEAVAQREGEDLWSLITGLQRRGMPAAQGVAMLQAAATLPDIQLLDGLNDAVGRPGTGVGLFNPHLGGLEVMIFDRSTFAYLGSRVIEEDGDILFDQAVVRVGVVDEVGELP